MNIIDRIFRKGVTMQSVAEPTEIDLNLRLGEVQAIIATGEGDIAAALEEEERLERAIKAERIRLAAATSRANREARAVQVAEYDKSGDAVMTELNTHMARLLFTLQDYDAVIAEGYKGGAAGRQWPAMFSGLDFDFAVKLRAAIQQLAPNTVWNFDVCLPNGKATRPTLKPAWGLKLSNAATTDIYGNRVGTKYL
jgi:hypothetical protein